MLKNVENRIETIFLSKKNGFSLQFFFVLRSSETYARRILPSAVFEGGRGLQIVF